jgi:hypothetical protein
LILCELRYVLICGLLSGIALVSWLLAGRQLVTLLDQITLVVVDRRGVDRLIYKSGTLELGGMQLDLTSPAYARIAELSLTSSGHLVLDSGGQRFSLGLGYSISDINGVPEFECTKDEGDEVLLTIEQSRLAWPTPFEMNFMTGYSSSRKRNVYFRLRWTKVSGSQLKMLWKTEQGYYQRDGWLPSKIEGVTDGLIHVSMQEAR